MQLHYVRVITPAKRLQGAFNAQGLCVFAKSRVRAVEAVARQARQYGFGCSYTDVRIRYVSADIVTDGKIIPLGQCPVDADDLKLAESVDDILGVLA